MQLQNIYNYDQSLDGYLNSETGEVLDTTEMRVLLNQETCADLGKQIRVSEGKQTLIKAEIDRLKDLLENEKKKEENLKNLALFILKELDIKKVDVGTMVISRRMNPGRLEIAPDADIAPYQYTETIEQVKTNKDQIKADLNAGKTIKGVCIIKDERIQLT